MGKIILKKDKIFALPKVYSIKKCEHCNNIIRFKNPFSCICKNCGYRVYPNKKIEFKERLGDLLCLK
jgi:hypothetical protein